jgi:hypothetical protein
MDYCRIRAPLSSWEFTCRTFGDQFGAINSLFSGAAFAGLIYTIWLQRQELRLQRIELRMQRKELALTRKEMENSTQAQNEAARALRSQVKLTANSAILSALSSLLEEATSAIESLRTGQRLTNNNLPYYASGRYAKELKDAEDHQRELKLRLESLLDQLLLDRDGFEE